MKILLDMNLSPLWVGELERAGFAAVHWSSVGRAGDVDDRIMWFASEHGFTVCTQDLDFGLMLAVTGHGKPSVIQLRTQDVLPASIGAKVVQALLQMEKEIDAGALVTIDPKKTRVRLLPLRWKT